MPEPRSSAPSKGVSVPPQTPQQAQPVSETFIAHAMQLMTANSYTPTQAQVDKMLSLQEKGMDYTHNERIHFSPQLISTLIVFAVLAAIIVGLFVFCVFFAPQYASQIITAAVSLATGAFGGYSYGTSKSRKKDNGDD